MKRVLSIFFMLSFTALQFVSAKPFNGIHDPVNNHNKTTNIVKHKYSGGSATNDIYIVLAQKVPVDSPYSFVTGVHIAFDTSYNSNLYESEDALDFGAMFGGSNTFSIIQGSTLLSIEGRQLPTLKDTIAFAFQSPTATIYQLLLDGTTFQGNGLKAYLYDNYLKKNIVINDSISFYNFTVNPANDSTFFNRFSIVFKSSTLPINSISLSSSLKENAVSLNWKTVGESNLLSYCVEKSVDGIKYSSLGTVAPKNAFAATYTFTDDNVSIGNSYYRIKSINKNGLVTYSAVSTITKGGALIGFGVYPNPIQNKTVNVKFDQVAKGNYIVILYNSLGKQVFTKQIQHVGGTATYNTTIDAVLSTGIYKLSITPALGGNSVYTTNVLVQK